METIPVVSIGHLSEKYINGSSCKEDLYNDETVKDILAKITDAFTRWGFVYLTDHGINSDNVSKASREFFEKDKTFKSQFVRLSNEDNWGYVPYKYEAFDKTRPFDLKECFNFTLPRNKDEKIGEFFDTGLEFAQNCHKLTNVLLDVLSLAICDDKEFLRSRHKYIDDIQKNATTLRLLYYPSIENEEDILDKQLRCGEHSDYGTITLLFQDEAGGLQVVSPNGEYVDATPIPGSIVVNIGDMMQIWTAGKFKSTRHRVLVANRHQKARQSMAYFVQPDDDVEVSCLDGSDKFKPVKSKEYLISKFSDTYG